MDNDHHGVVQWNLVDTLDEQIANHPIGRILLQSSHGKIVLASYRDRGVLERSIRNLACRLVIEEEKRKVFQNLCIGNEPRQLNRFKIERNRFIQLSEHFGSLFPTESQYTFYSIPRRNARRNTLRNGGRSSHRNASGCLYDHYKYCQDVLRGRRIVRSRTNENSAPNADAPAVPESENNQLEWLQNHLEPSERVIEYWNNTFDSRYAIRAGISIYAYYEKFPCLKGRLGVNLLKADFDHLYPNREQGFFDRFRTIRDYLIEKLQNRIDIEAGDGELIERLPGLLAHNKDTLIVYFLPYFIDSPVIIRQNTEAGPQPARRRLSIEEHRNSFFIHVENAADVQPALTRKKEELRRDGLTLQPLPIFVGPLMSVEAAYVVINDIIYEAESSLHAINTCFQSSFALEAEYPLQSSQLWRFLQICGFDIRLDSDDCNRSLNVLIGEVQHRLNNGN